MPKTKTVLPSYVTPTNYTAELTQTVPIKKMHSPLGSIDSICLQRSIAASNQSLLNVLGISNTFQTSIFFAPNERSYLSLPPFYLESSHSQWPE
jgi:hypothetical protein